MALPFTLWQTWKKGKKRKAPGKMLLVLNLSQHHGILVFALLCKQAVMNSARIKMNKRWYTDMHTEKT